MKNIWYGDEIKSNIMEEWTYVEIGELVKRFNGSDNTIGILIMNFSSQEEILEKWIM